MTIRSDSYSSVAALAAVSRHLLDGQTTFNSTTTPTVTQVESFIDEASGHLNVALSGAGLTTPVTNSTAVLTLNSWVRWKAADYVESTQMRRGFGGEEAPGMIDLNAAAMAFVNANLNGWKRLGAVVSHKASEGLTFTGLDAQADRSDPDDTSLRQPLFRRDQWDNS